MTFEFTSEQQEWSRRARELSARVLAGQAQSIDDNGVIPDDVRAALTAGAIDNPFSHGAVAGSLALEEIAAQSAGVATALGLEWTGQTAAGDISELPGLRGSSPAVGLTSAAQPERVRLVLCVVAIGVAKAAMAQAVEVMKARGIRPSGDEPTPHWALADAATELDAARLLVLSAAQIVERGEPADVALSMAARLSAAAAERGVEAASVIEGPSGYRRGGALDRLTRDARTLKLLLA